MLVLESIKKLKLRQQVILGGVVNTQSRLLLLRNLR